MTAHILFLTYTIGMTLGFVAWPFIAVPAGETYGIVSGLTEKDISPFTQMLRFLVLVSLPALILFILPVRCSKSVAKTRVEGRDGFVVPAVLTCFLLLSAGLFQSTPHSSEKYDAFHEGEVLAAGVASEHGLVAYKDYRFIHGFFENPGKVTLAFNLFGRSVGSVRTVNSLLQLFAFLCLGGLLLMIVQGKYSFALPLALGVSLLTWEKVKFLPQIIMLPRDGLPLLWASLSLLIIRKSNNRLGFVVGALASIQLLFAVDRAYYCIFGTIMLPIFVPKEARTRKFCTHLFCGLLVGFALALFFFFQGAGEFLHYVFWTLPKTHDLNSGRVLSLGNVPLLFSAFLFSAGGFWLVYIWKTSSEFWNPYKQEVFLFLLALLWFRSVLNRADEEHVHYNSFFLYLFWGSVCVRHIYSELEIAKVRMLGVQFASFLVFMLCLVRTDFLSVFPCSVPDSEILPKEYSEFASKTRGMIGDEDLFVLSMDSTWYYILDKPTPSGYTMAWFAATTDMQEQVVARLKEKKVQWVLQRNGGETLDSVYLHHRIPRIFHFVDSHYQEAFSHKAYRLLKRKEDINL